MSGFCVDCKRQEAKDTGNIKKCTREEKENMSPGQYYFCQKRNITINFVAEAVPDVLDDEKRKKKRSSLCQDLETQMS